MINSTHTKRSPEFSLRLAQVVSRLDGLIEACGRTGGRPELGEFLQEVRIMLLDSTSDSSCLLKAKEDEPVFVLKGKDPCAPAAIWAWIEKSKRMNLHEENRQDAEECRVEMMEYQKRLMDEGRENIKIH